MESLGGDQNWRVRFLAQHAAIVYFFVLIGLWITSPSLAYNFSQLIEAHAVDTYTEFAESNRGGRPAYLPCPLQINSFPSSKYSFSLLFIFRSQ